MTEDISKVEGFDKMLQFLKDSVGKPARLHMCMLSNPCETQVIISGFVSEYGVWNHSPNKANKREGFYIQLAKRDGTQYSTPENFAGTFDYFEVKEAGISRKLVVMYKDKTFFEIEIFG